MLLHPTVPWGALFHSVHFHPLLSISITSAGSRCLCRCLIKHRVSECSNLSIHTPKAKPPGPRANQPAHSPAPGHTAAFPRWNVTSYFCVTSRSKPYCQWPEGWQLSTAHSRISCRHIQNDHWQVCTCKVGEL